MPRPTTNTKYLTVRMDEDLLEKLAELAKQNERSASSEARLAIRHHLGEPILAPLSTYAEDHDPRPAA